TARRSPAGRVNLMATRSRIISSAPLSAWPAGPRVFTEPDEQTQAFMHSRNARTSMLANFWHPRVGPKRSMRCCLQQFALCAANRSKTEESTIRTIHSVRVRQKSPCVTIEFDGDGFLYKMVRLMVGSLVHCALGKMNIEDISARVHSAQVESTRFAAPAEGL